MFRRPAHRRVVALLEAFDADLLARCGFLFGGGTRIALWSPVDCLTVQDCFAEKLLANSDRWGDRQVLSRDLIDLAALRLAAAAIPEESWSKVEAAYKSAARTDLVKALDAFTADAAGQRRCWEGLSIETPEKILQGLALLRRDSLACGTPP